MTDYGSQELAVINQEYIAKLDGTEGKNSTPKNDEHAFLKRLKANENADG